jgi:hypothetical protein
MWTLPPQAWTCSTGPGESAGVRPLTGRSARGVSSRQFPFREAGVQKRPDPCQSVFGFWRARRVAPPLAQGLEEASLSGRKREVVHDSVLASGARPAPVRDSATRDTHRPHPLRGAAQPRRAPAATTPPSDGPTPAQSESGRRGHRCRRDPRGHYMKSGATTPATIRTCPPLPGFISLTQPFVTLLFGPRTRHCHTRTRGRWPAVPGSDRGRHTCRHPRTRCSAAP